MLILSHFKRVLILVVAVSATLYGQKPKIVTNHVGYEANGHKKAILVAHKPVDAVVFWLVNADTDTYVLEGKVVDNGGVAKWKDFVFYTIDFSKHLTEGKYYIKVLVDKEPIVSYPFAVGNELLERSTLSDVLYYFKGQRSSGLIDKMDERLPSPENKESFVDLHGGWYDATGDYGKHLSLLTFTTYFNPQEIPLVVWSLLKTHALLDKKEGRDYVQQKRRILDEAMYGADYLARLYRQGGSFYRSVAAPGKEKLPKDRLIDKESAGHQIKQSNEDSWDVKTTNSDIKDYQSSFRSGGGISIAALAMAAAQSGLDDSTRAKYLEAAEGAFEFLNKNNNIITNDGKDNVVDDYCALEAATELYKTTRKNIYKEAADKRAKSLINRLVVSEAYGSYWRADQADRPFFHPTDAGFPIISLLDYSEIADKSVNDGIKRVTKQALLSVLKITNEVNNPFGYSRQLVQEASTKKRKTSFFFPHDSEASPWWQGENARLSSMAAAARAAIKFFPDDEAFRKDLQAFAINQLNWILGLNPFDSCMLQGKGHNNPQYGFFGTYEYVNAPGGIVNGITSGIDNEDDIDFNVPYSKTGKDYDWRWAEQWLPHTSWYIYAVALGKK